MMQFLANYYNNSFLSLIIYESKDKEFTFRQVEFEILFKLKDILTDISSYYPLNIEAT